MSLCIGDFDHLWHDVLEMNLPSLWFFWQVLQATDDGARRVFAFARERFWVFDVGF